MSRSEFYEKVSAMKTAFDQYSQITKEFERRRTEYLKSAEKYPFGIYKDGNRFFAVVDWVYKSEDDRSIGKMTAMIAPIYDQIYELDSAKNIKKYADGSLMRLLEKVGMLTNGKPYIKSTMPISSAFMFTNSNKKHIRELHEKLKRYSVSRFPHLADENFNFHNFERIEGITMVEY